MPLFGDTHGGLEKLSSSNFPLGKILTRKDHVGILGDYGLFFGKDSSPSEIWWRKWIESKPWTTIFFDGNHDDMDILLNLPIVDFCGGKAGQVAENVFYLRRGEIYTIEGKTFFVFGGARTTDRMNERTQGIDWWANEVASEEEKEYGLENLRKHNHKVDYILTHTAPRRIILDHIVPIEPRYHVRASDPMAHYFDLIEDVTEFSHWFFGHFHMDLTFEDNFHLLFNEPHILDFE